MLMRVHIQSNGVVQVPLTEDDDLPALTRALESDRAAVEPQLEPAEAALYGAALVALVGLLPLLTTRPEVAAPSAAPVSEALLALAPREVLQERTGLNHFIDRRAGAAQGRVLGALESFEAEEVAHAQRVLSYTFEGGRGFLTLKGRHQHLEVERRFKNLPEAVRASVEALGLGSLWGGIAALNDHYGELLGVVGEPPAPVSPAQEAHQAALAAAQTHLRRLYLLSNLVAARDEALGERLLRPWVTLQREYAAGRRRA